jgi:hypothetical protein
MSVFVRYLSYGAKCKVFDTVQGLRSLRTYVDP